MPGEIVRFGELRVLFTVESNTNMNLTYESVVCAIVVKYYLMLGGKESRPYGVFYQVYKTIEGRFARFCDTITK